MNFKDLTRFAMRRSPAEAVWFYAAYAVLGYAVTIGIALVVLPYIDTATMQDDVLSQKLGRSVAIVLASGLTLAIVLAKDYHSHVIYLALILLAAIFGAWGGLFLGLLIPAVLTTLKYSGDTAAGGSTSFSKRLAEWIPLPPVVNPDDKYRPKSASSRFGAAETKAQETAQAHSTPVVKNVAKVIDSQKNEIEEKQTTKQMPLLEAETFEVKAPEKASSGPIKYSVGDKKIQKSTHNPLLTLESVQPPSTETVQPPMVQKTELNGASKKKGSSKKAA